MFRERPDRVDRSVRRGDLRPQIATQWSKMRAYSELFMSVAFFNTRLTATLLIERELTSAGIHL
jgi:hypothetical protein